MTRSQKTADHRAIGLTVLRFHHRRRSLRVGSSALAVRPPVMMAAALTVWLRTGHVVRRRGSIDSLAMGRALAMGRSLTMDRGLAMHRDLAMGRRLAMNRDLATCSGPTWE